jgi:hypothetical protein
MNPLETYLHDLNEIRSSGAAVKETSYYGPLASLFNEIGKTLKPKVKCIINLQNQGAGLPDGGFFTQSNFRKPEIMNPYPARCFFELPLILRKVGSSCSSPAGNVEPLRGFGSFFIEGGVIF